MGDAADDALDSALREQQRRQDVAEGLRRAGCQCRRETPVDLNDDGLYECAGCGRVVDL